MHDPKPLHPLQSRMTPSGCLHKHSFDVTIILRLYVNEEVADDSNCMC